MAALDQLVGLNNLINSLKGQSQTTKTSGGTTTQQTQVSDAGIAELLDRILAGPGGVKSIGTSARRSGLYNSTSEDTLLGNLYATAANQAELARSPTVTTTTPQTSTTKAQGASVGDLATGLGTAFLASQALNIGSKALSPAIDAGSNYVSDLVSGLFGVGGTSGGGQIGRNITDDLANNVDFGGYGSFGGPIASGSTTFNSGEGFGIDTSTLGSFGGTSATPGAKGFNFGLDLDTGAASIGIGGGLGAVGSILSPVLGGLLGSSGGGGGRNGTTGGSIICTALKERGLLDEQLYAAGSEYIQKVNPLTKLGYYYWAEGVAEKIRNGHKGWTVVCKPFATGRTALLAKRGSFWDHLRHPLGSLTKFVGEPICFAIGAVIFHFEMKAATQVI